MIKMPTETFQRRAIDQFVCHGMILSPNKEWTSKARLITISHFRYPFPSSSGGFAGRFNLVMVLRRPWNQHSHATKVGCVFPVVVVFILPHAEFGPNALADFRLYSWELRKKHFFPSFSFFLFFRNKVWYQPSRRHTPFYILLAVVRSKREPDYLEAVSTLPLLVAFKALKFNSYSGISAFDTFLIDFNDSGVPWPLNRSFWFSAMHCLLSKRSWRWKLCHFQDSN